MEHEHSRLSPQEKSLLNFLRQHGICFSEHDDASDIRDYVAREVKGFFNRITSDGINKIFQRLFQKGYLLRDEEGWYRLAAGEPHTDIQIVGRITAGYLQEAIRSEMGFVRFDGVLNQADQLFALEVDGLSMIGDEIYDGDCVLLRRAEVRNGQIGAVIVDGETTLKRIYREPDGIRLVPSNPDFEPIFIPRGSRSCHVLGRLEAVINRSGHVRWISSRNPITEISLFLN